MAEFVEAYNHEHRDSEFEIQTPADMHFGLTTEVDQARRRAMHAARQSRPERFANTNYPKH